MTASRPTSAVVVGAAGGIGGALVRALAERADHAPVFALSRSQPSVPEGVRTLPIDLSDEATVAAAAAIVAEKKARAEGLEAQAKALSGSGGKAMVKLKVAEALKGKKIVFLPAGAGTDLRSTDMNALLQTYGLTALAESPVPLAQ